MRGQEVQVGVGEVGDREDFERPAGVKAGEEKDVADLLREAVVESEKGLRSRTGSAGGLPTGRWSARTLGLE